MIVYNKLNERSLWRSGNDSDLIVRCKDKDFHVHKIVLKNQSEYFHLALKSEYLVSRVPRLRQIGESNTTDHTVLSQESETNIVHEHERSSSVMQVVLGFCYHIGYSPSTDENEFAFLVQVYEAANFYMLPGLNDHVVKAFSARAEKSLGPDLHLVTETIPYIYSTFESNDRRLKDVVVRLAAEFPYMLGINGYADNFVPAKDSMRSENHKLQVSKHSQVIPIESESKPEPKATAPGSRTASTTDPIEWDIAEIDLRTQVTTPEEFLAKVPEFTADLAMFHSRTAAKSLGWRCDKCDLNLRLVHKASRTERPRHTNDYQTLYCPGCKQDDWFSSGRERLDRHIWSKLKQEEQEEYSDNEW